MQKLSVKTKIKSFFVNAVKPRNGAEYAEIFSRGLKEEDKTASAEPRKPWLYLRVLAFGFIAFSLAVSIFCLFNSQMDYAIAVFFGGLFCNVALVFFFFELYPKRDLSLALLGGLLLFGGLISSGLASFGYEFIFDANSGNAWVDCLFVGFWEEFCKALVAIVAIVLLKKKEPFACFLIGIAVGSGYSVYEDLGYILSYSSGYSSTSDTWLVLMSIGRGLSCVCSHAPWTAIICWAFAKFKKPFINFRFYGFFIASAVLHYLADVPFFDDNVAFLTGLNWGWAIEAFVVVAIFLIMIFTLRNSTRALLPQEGTTATDSEVPVNITDGQVLIACKREKLSLIANLTITLCLVVSCILLLIVCALPVYTQMITQEMTIEEYVDYKQCNLPLKADWDREYDKDYGDYTTLQDKDGRVGVAVQKVTEEGYDYYYQYVFTEDGESELYSIGVKVENELVFNTICKVYNWGYSFVTPDNMIGTYYPDELIPSEGEETVENGFHKDEELLFTFTYFSIGNYNSINVNEDRETVTVYMGRDDINNDLAYIILLSVAGAIMIGGATTFITLKINGRRIKMKNENCVFCAILGGQIPSSKVYEDDKMLVFRDIEPKAKIHLLAIPKTHFKLLSEMNEERAEILKYMLLKIPQIAKENGLQNGYRLVINQGDDAGQTVFHLHIHILGGEILPW
ncbi:MAG: HIT domain-containing protein [Clostridia bacterium]|nr:HIT domain-containing protein [Clostridia bacterium]